MRKQLNHEVLKKSCAVSGMSQSDLAERLGVTRAAVSKWFTGKSFPRPAELLKLGRLLGVRYHELVEESQVVEEPVVAFRKRANCRTTEEDVRRARELGHFLRPLVEYLEFDEFVGPPLLKNPSTDYCYLQGLVAKLRREIDVAEDAPMGFEKLIGLFRKYQAVIIPTLWGKKSKHENALHLYLPDSRTTWIYLNLDVAIHDFKFWMVHELAHVLTVELLQAGRVDEAEEFADAFSGAFLFPKTVAHEAFVAYQRLPNDSDRIALLCDWAKNHLISPNTVYREMRNYAVSQEEIFTEIDGEKLFGAITRFNQRFPSFTETLFDGKKPNANEFIRKTEEVFGIVFFKAFGRYVREKQPSPSGIGSVLNVNPMDARGFYDALTH